MMARQSPYCYETVQRDKYSFSHLTDMDKLHILHISSTAQRPDPLCMFNKNSEYADLKFFANKRSVTAPCMLLLCNKIKFRLVDYF